MQKNSKIRVIVHNEDNINLRTASCFYYTQFIITIRFTLIETVNTKTLHYQKCSTSIQVYGNIPTVCSFASLGFHLYLNIQTVNKAWNLDTDYKKIYRGL